MWEKMRDLGHLPWGGSAVHGSIKVGPKGRLIGADRGTADIRTTAGEELAEGVERYHLNAAVAQGRSVELVAAVLSSAPRGATHAGQPWHRPAGLLRKTASDWSHGRELSRTTTKHHLLNPISEGRSGFSKMRKIF